MSSIPVYIGRWHDHSRSQILGDTITLDVRWGGYLIAALSTFVGLVGTALWSLIAFIIHQWRARPGEDDGVFFHQQVVYRNQGTAVGALLDLVKISWAWRRRRSQGQRVDRLKRRSCLYSLPPLLVFAAFTAAGVFIGEVAGPTYESKSVRVKSSRCGFFSYNINTVDGRRAESLKAVNDTLSARQYAKTCYHSSGSLTDCALLLVQSLPYNSSLVPCPFGADPSGENSCIPGSGEALQLDTGLLDTNQYLGINAAPQNRLLLRNIVICSPIRIHDYVEVLNNTDPAFPSLQYNMGGTYLDAGEGTYIYGTHARADDVSYQITPVYALDGNQAWLPVPALNVSNADISAHFLAQNSVQYLAPVQDPWLSANQLYNDSEPGLDLILYGPDAFVSVMACTDQYQICNPASSPYDCTIIGSQKDLREGFLQIGLNPYQLATARRLALALEWTSTYQIVLSLSSTALLARDRLIDFIGTGLPANQWQLEVQGWFETSLAKLQSYVVDYAANIADLGPTGSVLAPSPDGDPATQAALDQCSNQRIRNFGAYQSFSFLGLMIVICVGLTILLLSWIVEPVVACVRREQRHNKHDYREIARIADQKLQLHRMALQGAGYVQGWDAERTMDEIPVTTRNTVFPAPLRHKVNNVDDYRYSAVPGAESDDEDDTAAAAPANGRPMSEVSTVSPPHPSPQSHPSQPWNAHATLSQQPLIQQNGQLERDRSSADAAGDL